jgi:hypothetical protein
MPVVSGTVRAPLTPDVLVPLQVGPLEDLDERVHDLEGGIQLALRSIRDLRAETVALRAEAVDLRAEAVDLRATAVTFRTELTNLNSVVHWFQRVYNWMAAAARNFPWH